MKAKTTRRALLTSVLSLILCVSMLVGTTFAWFTDSVTSGRNTIQSGNLDVVLEYWDGDSYEEVTKDTKLFNDAALWEPGYTEVAYLKVSNAGSLALKYQLAVNVYSETLGKTKDNADIKLSDYLVFGVAEKELNSAADEYTRETARTAAGTVKGLDSYNSGTKALKKTGDADYVALIVYMPESVGNEANHNGTNVPSIEMGVTLVATQQVAESDSFGPDYDEDAWHPNFVVNTVADMSTALANAKDGDIIALGSDIETKDGLVITDKNITIDLNGKTYSVSDGTTTNGRVFKINGSSVVTIKNGTLAAGAIAYGTIRTEGNANVTLDNVTLSNSRGNGLNIKAYAGTTVTVNNSVINATNGGGVEAAGGTVILNNTTINQTGAYDWCSTAIGVNGGGKAVVNSGTYTANTAGTWAAYVMSSGGTLEINGGDFIGVNASGIICADRAAVVKIYGGNFDSTGAILNMCNNVGTQPNPVATIAGGNFSANPTVSGGWNGGISLADNAMIIKNQDGTYTVVENASSSTMTMADGAVLDLGGVEFKGTVQAEGDLTIKGDTKIKTLSATKGGTITVEDGKTLTLNNFSFGAKSNNTAEYTITGGTIVASYGFFQHGTYALHSDFETGYMYYSYGSNITVYGTFHSQGKGDGLDYVRGNLTIAKGGKSIHDKSLWVGQPAASWGAMNASLTVEEGGYVQANSLSVYDGSVAYNSAANVGKDGVGIKYNSLSGTITVK